MKIAKFFLRLGLGIICMASLQVQGMNNEMTDQDFDKLFLYGKGNGLGSADISLSRRSIATQFGRSQVHVYPLEYSFNRWLTRVKNGSAANLSDGTVVQYTDKLVIEWITKLLENGAPCKYAGFNPLVCLLYRYDEGIITRDLFEQLFQLLCNRGANIDDKTEDRYLVGGINNNPGLKTFTPLETFININRAVSARDILENVQQSKTLQATDIRPIFNQNHDEPVAANTGDIAVPVMHAPEPALKPRIFNMSHMFAAVAISFVCGIGIKCLYDWYYTPCPQDEAAPEQDLPEVL
jgi:hypothetical protein